MVSVVMSVYNGERFLKEAVESVLGQTLREFEFIIIDDGSTDGTAAVLNSFGDPRIVRLRNAANLGLARSLNLGMEAARAELIARMDADDICLPERLARQVEFMAAHPEVGVLGTSARLIDAAGAVKGDLEYPADHAAIRWRLCFQNPIIHPSVMMRREVVRCAGGYDPELRASQDYALWQRLAPVTRFANLPAPLLRLRLHSASVSAQRADEQFQNGLLYGRKIMADLLGCDVAEREVRNIWRNEFSTSSGAWLAARLARDLARKCLSLASAEAARQIRHEARDKVAAIAGSCHGLDRWRVTIARWLL